MEPAGMGLVCVITTTGTDGEIKHRGAKEGYKCVKRTKEGDESSAV